jgi:hypothetical protein
VLCRLAHANSLESGSKTAALSPFYADRTHPSALGHALLGTVVSEHILTRLKEAWQLSAHAENATSAAAGRASDAGSERWEVCYDSATDLPRRDDETNSSEWRLINDRAAGASAMGAAASDVIAPAMVTTASVPTGATGSSATPSFATVGEGTSSADIERDEADRTAQLRVAERGLDKWGLSSSLEIDGGVHQTSNLMLGPLAPNHSCALLQVRTNAHSFAQATRSRDPYCVLQVILGTLASTLDTQHSTLDMYMHMYNMHMYMLYSTRTRNSCR